MLKDGRILRGRTGETVGLAEQNGAGEGDAIKQIVFVNDDFRLTFVSRRQVAAVRPDTSLENAEKFELRSSRGTGSATTAGRKSCRSARRRGP